MREPVYVTSFSADMLAATGQRVVNSFTKSGTPGRLVVYGEGIPVGGVVVKDGKRVTVRSIDGDKFLADWLAANRDIIPDYLGGTAKPCDCPNVQKWNAKHKFGCPRQWMNRNASRWFRKPVAVRRAAAEEAADLLVWIDADVRFVGAVPAGFWDGLLGGSGVAYCKGHRPAVESGVVVFDKGKGGREILSEWCDRYSSGNFRADERWDDGYQLAVTVSRSSFPSVDLVHPSKWKGKTNDVIPTTPIAAYLVHDKGTHGKRLGIMK